MSKPHESDCLQSTPFKNPTIGSGQYMFPSCEYEIVRRVMQIKTKTISCLGFLENQIRKKLETLLPCSCFGIFEECESRSF